MKNNIIINVAKEFTETPGARYRDDGDFSAQEFYEDMLVPKFKEAIEKEVKLVVELDGVYGYASSFLSGTFGKLAADYSSKKVKQYLLLQTKNKVLLELIEKEIEQ